jgi:hypothetical protein
MSSWIPALHAGMTQSRVLLELTEAPPPCIFKGVHAGKPYLPDRRILHMLMSRERSLPEFL